MKSTQNEKKRHEITIKLRTETRFSSVVVGQNIQSGNGCICILCVPDGLCGTLLRRCVRHRRLIGMREASIQ